MSIEDRRKDFPALDQMVHGHPLVYLDNAASTLKPHKVIDALTQHYSKETANVHRGIHYLSAQGTQKYEASRTALQKFINAPHEHEVIFTGGTTDAINLVANSWAPIFLKEGDEVLISTMEHHSNIVPWQIAAEKYKAKVLEIPVTDEGEIDKEAYKALLSSGKVKMVAMAHISNTLGTINPIQEFAKLAHDNGSLFLVDAAQSASHMKIDVQDLGVDFLCFGAHKMFGPTGVGILWGKEELLNQMPPYRSGGAMIKEVTIEKTTYNELPEKFEAGTPHIAGVNSFKAAVDYIEEIGFESIIKREKELLEYATEKIQTIPGIKIIGTAKEKASVLSFTLEGAHPHDIGMILDEQGVAIRTGHHCTQPLMKRYGVPATARASFSFYNNFEDVDRFIEALKKAKELL
ncbi:MAG: cysteine desulfurase [Halobacteriovoraceae bacterium]|nr:cysteine desulfurase [Halobacteriovoraceae bacterium]